MIEREKKKMRTYWFGANWKNFLRYHVNEESLRFSELRLKELLAPLSLQGRSFLDVGCGSGIHSLAALKLGAARVMGIDVDLDSVSATTEIRRKFGTVFMERWEIKHISILDTEEIDELGEFDVVYAWGSLHHSGDVWKAISNVMRPVKKGGYLILALYSKDVTPAPSHEFWLEIKKKYVSSGFLVRRFFEAWYIWRFIFNKNFINTKSVLTRFREYKEDRGMSLLVDIRDWLGGWPMEFVSDKDVIEFLEKNKFKSVKTITGKANTEFIFTRDA